MPDQGHGRQYGVFTSWQWAVIGSFLTAIILSLIVGFIAHRAQDNTERIDRALCAQIEFLNEVRSSQPPDRRARTTLLVVKLRKLEPHCPAAG